MARTYNSISDVTEQMLRAQKNSMEILTSLSAVTTSNQDFVEVTLLDENGQPQTLSIATNGNILNRLEQAEQNILELSSLGESDADIRLPDGSLRRILVSRLPVNPEPIANLAIPNRFNISNNWFFESFQNPLPSISINLGNQIDDRATEIAYSRFMLELDTVAKLDFFNENLKGRNDIDYFDFLADLARNDIDYFVDDERKSLPLNFLRFNGTFDVIRIRDEEVETTVDGETVTNQRRRYVLNTLNYRDSLTGATRRLQAGDQLIINNQNDNTKLTIETLDTGTNSITVKRVSGSDQIPVGTDVLAFASSIYSNKNVNVPIGIDEYTVIFFKPIDPDFLIAATDWSAGMAFYTNELSIETPRGFVPFSDYYKSDVIDFGKMLLEMAQVRPVPIQLGQVPDSPLLDVDNFKVVPINEHRINQQDEEELQKKYNEQITLKSEITEIENAINKVKNTLTTKQYKTQAERDKDVARRDSLIREKSEKNQLLNSLTLELAALGKSGNGALPERKYRIRGFWAIPAAKLSEDTQDQEVIGFEVRYRYRSKNQGNPPQERQLNFTDNSGEQREARFSNWTTLPEKIRERVLDENTGLYVWKQQVESDGNEININQLEIPITTGEEVEIQVRSISEAGYPSAPLKSEFSESVIVVFPDELENQATDQIVNNAISEESSVRFKEELDARGLDQHLAEQTIVNDKVFVHTADSIDSGERTDANSVKSLRQVIVELQQQITALQGTIDDTVGALRVSIVDENGVTTEVANNSTARINAGFYVEQIENLTIKKGAIVTKIYEVVIQNTSATSIELISYLPGNLSNSLPKFNSNQVLLGFQPSDYNFRGYERVPVGLRSVDLDELVSQNTFITEGSASAPDVRNLMPSTFKNKNPFQSKQVNSQWIYARYKDVGLTQDLYAEPTGEVSLFGSTFTGVKDGHLFPNITNGSTSYVWSGGFTGGVPDGSGELNDFCVHIEHPDLQPADPATGTATGRINAQKTTYDAALSNMWKKEYVYSPPRLVNDNLIEYPLISHSEYFNLRADQPNGLKQLGYVERFNGDPDTNNWIFNSKKNETEFIDSGVTPYELQNQGNSTLRSLSRVTHSRKLGFDVNDQYLIGSQTCGAYLFLAPDDYSAIAVDGSTFLARKKIEVASNNESNSIKVPVVFQYRMTDFDGSGTTGFGNLAGLQNSPLTNLQYTKKIGLDIWVSRDEVFSFDLQVSAKYKAESSVTSSNFTAQNQA